MIKVVKMTVLAAFAIFAMFISGVEAADLSNDTRVALHVELRGYIEAKTNDGVYTYFDEAEAKIETLRLKRIHPVVFGRGDRYLLCADFVDEAGKDVVIDYVVLPVAEGYLIEKEIEGKRPFLTAVFEKLM